jgi:hypothetical protein
MRDMKNIIRYALMICLGAGLVGCEWEGSGDENSWNSRYNFVNFSGNYRGQGGGGYLVSEYTTSPVSSGDTGSGTSYAPVTGEADGTAPAAQLVINGKLNYGPIKPGSVTVLFGNVGEFRDDGAGGLSGSYERAGNQKFTGAGTIDYDTGVWTVVLEQNYPLDNPMPISVNYAYAVGSSGATTATSTPGSTKVSIYAFNVIQEGNKLRIVDNNGSVYEGGFGSIRSTSGTDQDTSFPTYSEGDQVMGQFEVSGRSAANITVKMVGNFQATISGVSSSSGGTTSMRLTDRRILGTWIEVGGKTGDLNGQAVPIVVSTTTTTTP